MSIQEIKSIINNKVDVSENQNLLRNIVELLELDELKQSEVFNSYTQQLRNEVLTGIHQINTNQIIDHKNVISSAKEWIKK